MHVETLPALVLTLVLVLLGAASAQTFAPERILRHLAGDADIVLLQCPPTSSNARASGRILLCGRYEYGVDGFQMDVERAAADLMAFGAWSDDDGVYSRTYLDEEALDQGLFHVGYRNGAVMLTFYPRGS